MTVQQRLYDIDDLWRLVCEADDDKQYELIEGEIIEMSPPGEEHGLLAAWLGKFLIEYAFEHNLGRVTIETGYYPTEDHSILLSPGVAFRRLEQTTTPPSQTWVPLMPDIAVEVQSPSNTLAELRQKADLYLQNGTRLVWLIIPRRKSAEVCRLDAAGKIYSQTIDQDGALSGEEVLPGFALPLAKLFVW